MKRPAKKVAMKRPANSHAPKASSSSQAADEGVNRSKKVYAFPSTKDWKDRSYQEFLDAAYLDFHDLKSYNTSYRERVSCSQGQYMARMSKSHGRRKVDSRYMWESIWMDKDLQEKPESRI